ncbi:hypothetical protein F5X68DRAFT_236244 [Plectosphaerella plurivora]|uniref:RNase III domain-containing protein n=1 Tax=Plectosphaerella plurivora TaxID=936078 RepID=A0A9P8V453_9PEZI|nr:hypothetical protein F5X68DRAFT_236244 [Plectosphaerella plurivora]
MWTTTDGRTLKQGNKPLAGIGDRIISLYITEVAFNEGLTIGDTNRLLQTRASNEYLAGIFDDLCLDEEIVKNPCQPDKISMRTKATTVEAIVGAVYQDGGMDGAMAVLEYLNI